MADGSLRFDRFCWNVRLVRTRTAAAAVAEAGHARLNGRRVEKPSTAIHIGDVLTLPHGSGVRIVRVLALPPRRIGPPMVPQMIEEIDASAEPS